MDALASIRMRQNGQTSETSFTEAEITLSNGVSFLIVASEREDGAVMLHIPADEKKPNETCAFSITPGAANTIFVTANKLNSR